MLTHPVPRPAGSGVGTFLVLISFLLLPAAASGGGGPAPSYASPSSPPPAGLVVVIEDKPQETRLNLRALENAYISGVALQIRWSDLEPADGSPNWSKLDQLFAAAESQQKWVQLLIFAGFFSPAWALEGVHTETFPLQYGPGKGTVAKPPMPWDEVYLNRWYAFVRLLSARYTNSPAFRVMAASGPHQFFCGVHPAEQARGYPDMGQCGLHA
jgi:hypothetical protein